MTTLQRRLAAKWNSPCSGRIVGHYNIKMQKSKDMVLYSQGLSCKREHTIGEANILTGGHRTGQTVTMFPRVNIFIYLSIYLFGHYLSLLLIRICGIRAKRHLPYRRRTIFVIARNGSLCMHWEITVFAGPRLTWLSKASAKR